MPMLRAALVAALASAAQAGPAAAQPGLDGTPHVTATGTCLAELVPDRAALSVAVTRRGPDAARVSADATAVFNALRRDVDALRLPGAVLEGNGLSLRRNVDGSGQRPVFRGYIASAGLHVESSDPARLAEVIPLAARAGIDDVGEIALSVSEARRRAAELDCLPRASADARARAEALAEGLGVALGPVLRIGESRRDGSAHPVDAARRMQLAAPAPPPDVPLGVQRLEVTTTVTFSLGPVRP